MSQKKIVVLGAGESGTGAAILAKAKGFDVFVSDLSEIKEPGNPQGGSHHTETHGAGHSHNIGD